MKQMIYMLLVLSCLLASCKKDTNNSGVVVEYQVTSSNTSAQLVIGHNNKDGQFIPGNYQSGWKTSFTPTNLPFAASLYVGTLGPEASQTVTLKILVNNNVVKQATKTLLFPSSPSEQIQFTVN